MTSLGIIAYSPADKMYTYYAIDSGGMGDYSIGKKSGDTWTFTSTSAMDGKPFYARYNMVERSPTSYTFKWACPRNGAKWTTMMEGMSTKKTE